MSVTLFGTSVPYDLRELEIWELLFGSTACFQIIVGWGCVHGVAEKRKEYE